MRLVALAYLSLGSNVGDRAANLQHAITRLGEHGRVTQKSSFYETEPVDVVEQPWFLNCVVALECEDPPHALLAHLLDIERQLGRIRNPREKKGPRIIDIDILLLGDVVLDSPSLTIPHPEMHRRRFVLEPLAEIAPQATHPLLHMNAQQILSQLPPQPVVRKA
jgi:2-amino-4-hydroxy-6-hydroxymethyldihydropteridine diphosphokinase